MPFNFKNLLGWLKGALKRTPVPSPVRFDRPLGGAIHDAEVLLAFAVQSRRSLKGELLAKMSQASETLRAAADPERSASAAERTAFWQAYDELAVVMAPLSAHSIRSSTVINAKRFPGSLFTPPALLALVAIAVFAFCMVVQSFWVAGKSLFDAADAIEAQRVQLVRKYALSLQAANSAESKYKQLLNQLEQRESAPTPAPGASLSKSSASAEMAEMAQLKVQLGILRADLFEKRLITEQQSSELEDANGGGRPLQGLLKQWHGRARSICDKTIRFLCPVDNNSDDQRLLDAHRLTLSKAEEMLQSAEVPFAGRGGDTKVADAGSSRLFRSFENMKLQKSVDQRKRVLAGVEAEMQRKTSYEVRIILENLATYIIPAAMGLLGSLAFLLQSMAGQLREHTYTPVSVSASIMRFCLGAIAGVFGGLAGPGSDAILKGLPPLFIPFVFGYGIEILFSLLDRVVQTFTQVESPKTRPL